MWNKLRHQLLENTKDESFLYLIHRVENIVSKVLSLVLLIVIVISLVDLIVILTRDLLAKPIDSFEKSIIDIFGLFLNILIALELLENVTAYLRKHIVQVELVIVTSLIAVARKIIIFDFTKYQSLDLMALAVTILALALSYWLIRHTNKQLASDEK